MRLVGSAEMREIDRAAIEDFGIPVAHAHGPRRPRASPTRPPSSRRRAAGSSSCAAAGTTAATGTSRRACSAPPGATRASWRSCPPERLSPDARAVREQADRAGVPIDEGRARAARRRRRRRRRGRDLRHRARAPAGGRVRERHRARSRRRGSPARGSSRWTSRPASPPTRAGRSGACVRADRTVTFGFPKRGLALHPGLALAGEVTVVDIGIPPEAARRVPVDLRAPHRGRGAGARPAAPPEAHKGDAGRLLVVAGSAGEDRRRAPRAHRRAPRRRRARDARRARARCCPLALAGRPEAMSLALPGDGPLGRADLSALLAAAREVDALVLGPGHPARPGDGRAAPGAPRARREAGGGRRRRAERARRASRRSCPASASRSCSRRTPARWRGSAATTIGEVQADRIGIAAAKARDWSATVLLKGARTVVADPDAPPAIIPTGNPGLATGGTGDVLAGPVRRAPRRRPRRRRRRGGSARGCTGAPATSPRRASASAGSSRATSATRSARSGRSGGGDGAARRRGSSRARRARPTRSGNGSGGSSRPGDVVALVGDLGAGKTQLVRGACAGAGVRPEEVSSPSFAIVATYARAASRCTTRTSTGSPTRTSCTATGFGDLVGGEGALLVEWADRIPSALPAEKLTIRLAHDAPDVGTWRSGCGTRARGLRDAATRGGPGEPGRLDSGRGPGRSTGQVRVQSRSQVESRSTSRSQVHVRRSTPSDVDPFPGSCVSGGKETSPCASLALAVLVLPALSLAAPAVKAPSRIDAVTVYRTGARVTRVARVDLPAGAGARRPRGAPGPARRRLDARRGEGRARARVFGVTRRADHRRRRRCRRGARRRGAARAAAGRGPRPRRPDQAAQARLEFVRSLRSTYSEERAKNLAVRGVTAREWAELAAFVAGELQEATQEVRKAEVARRELGRRIAQARADLEKVQAKRGKTTKTVVVEVEAERAGPLERRGLLRGRRRGLAAGLGRAARPGRAGRWSSPSSARSGSGPARTGTRWRSRSRPRSPRAASTSPSSIRSTSRGPSSRARCAQGAAAVAADGGAPRRRRARRRARPARSREEERRRGDRRRPRSSRASSPPSFTAPRRETVDGSGQARKIALRGSRSRPSSSASPRRASRPRRSSPRRR